MGLGLALLGAYAAHRFLSSVDEPVCSSCMGAPPPFQNLIGKPCGAGFIYKKKGAGAVVCSADCPPGKFRKFLPQGKQPAPCHGLGTVNAVAAHRMQRSFTRRELVRMDGFGVVEVIGL